MEDNLRSRSEGVSPHREGTPSSASDNTQLQWVISAMTQLKNSHDTLASKIEQQASRFEDKLDSKHERLEERIKSKHESLDERLKSSHDLLCSKIDLTEIKIGKNISDSKIATIKWLFGIVLGCPSIIWVGYQLIKAISKN
ncbi:hypothetical protein FG435_004297 [Yersinia enterocolitica]|nr:hypothetical protein [Yersinia enterocolitica]EKN4900043.1 hypothetical protein [Yersinia enterocolitica]